MEFGVTVLPDPPHTVMLDRLERAEASGFGYGWTYDSHILWQECFPLLTAMALRTSTMNVGLCVTNPGTREPTVLASAHAHRARHLGRTRRDGNRPRRLRTQDDRAQARPDGRVRGRLPNDERPDERAKPCSGTIRSSSSSGRRTVLRSRCTWRGTGRKPSPWPAASRDGVIIQLADPEIVDWIMGIARRAAEEDGCDPAKLSPVVCAPAFVSADLQHACDQVRWFPAMVSNHVMDLLKKYDESELPSALFEYVKQREFYDYKDHSRVGAEHGQFVDDDTCDRFCILGTPEQHIEKLKALEAIGVAQWNVYLMAGDESARSTCTGRRSSRRFDVGGMLTLLPQGPPHRHQRERTRLPHA